MTEKEKICEVTVALRQQAEDKLKSRSLQMPEDIAALSPEQIQKMVHELRIHQIELEMQNEALQTAQAELEKSRSRYFDLYDMAPVGYCTISEKGLILEANLTAATLLGPARNALVKQPISGFILNEDQDIYYLHRKKLFETGEPQECELRLVRPDGALFWAHLTATAAQAEDGAPVCRVLLSDITERKQTEEALRESETRFKTLHNASFGGIAIHDQGIILECNQGLSAMTGYQYSELIGMNGLLLIAERSRKKVMNNIRTGYEKPYEAFGLRENGEEFLMQLEARNVPYKGKQVRTVEFRDITERKLAEEALRESENKFRSLVEQAAEMLFLHDLKGNFIDVNLAATKNTGYSKEELRKMTVFNIDPDARERDDMRNYWESLKVKDPPVTFEVRHRRKNGSVYSAEVSSSKIALNDGLYILVLARDITERKVAEEEKEHLQTQLNQAQKMETVGRLAGGVAHDFNNMLGVILGHTELALLKAGENHDLYSDLKEIQTAATRSTDITKQLLAFARKQTISPRQVNLNDAVESLLNMLRRLIGEDIDLAWKPAAQLWPVKIDPSQIDQILANLCINARDAIDGVGKLTIETGTKSFDEEYCSDHPDFIPGDFVLLAVSDNGCGMDKDTMSNLFEPFFTTKEVGKGTGLGLATVYGIVKQNNGFINVYSEPGQGSTFKIYLSRFFADEGINKAVPETKSVTGGTETILLVEDEPSILRMTLMMLERKGYNVLPAATPSKAVKKAKNHSGAIDLLMTDVVMPEMNGRDLAEKITALYPGIRLLFMSGYTADVITHQGVLDDSVAFIQKPFSIADMTVKVRELLDMASDKNQG